MDGLYSPLSDQSLRNVTTWPLVHFSIYDVEQMRWVDLPTFARIEVRQNDFLMLRAKSSMQIDSGEFPAMDSLIVQLRARYCASTPENTEVIPETIVKLPDTPTTDGFTETASAPAPRRVKRKRSQVLSSPVRVAQGSSKRKRVRDSE